MKVILNADIANLGEEGDVLEVKPGYARNYLLPQQLASPCTKKYLDLLEGKRVAIEKRKEEKRAAAKSQKEQIEAVELELAMPAGDSGKLFGAVTNATIVDGLAAKGIEIERKRIEIPEHTIKMVGNYKVKVRLYANESAELKVNVVAAEAAAE